MAETPQMDFQTALNDVKQLKNHFKAFARIEETMNFLSSFNTDQAILAKKRADAQASFDEFMQANAKKQAAATEQLNATRKRIDEAQALAAKEIKGISDKQQNALAQMKREALDEQAQIEKNMAAIRAANAELRKEEEDLHKKVNGLKAELVKLRAAVQGILVDTPKAPVKPEETKSAVPAGK